MDTEVMIKYIQSVKSLLTKVLNYLESSQQTTKTAEVLENELGLSKEAAEQVATKITSASSPVDIVKAMKGAIGEDFITMKVANDNSNKGGNIDVPEESFFEWLSN